MHLFHSNYFEYVKGQSIYFELLAVLNYRRLTVYLDHDTEISNVYPIV